MVQQCRHRIMRWLPAQLCWRSRHGWRGFSSKPFEDVLQAVRSGTVKQVPCATQSGVRDARTFVEQFDDASYAAMARDPHRSAAFREAIGRAEFIAGRVGVDLGTGRDALLAQMCIKAGARKVFAIEANADAARRAKQLVASLGMEEQIEVISAWVQDLSSLPERADFIVQEILGEVASAEGAISAVEHARHHFLAPGADNNCIPACARTIAAGCEMPSLDAGCLVGPTKRILLCSATSAQHPVTDDTFVETLDFRSSCAGNRSAGELQLSLPVTRAAELATIRLHMEYLPLAAMRWSSTLSPFSHWKHVHVIMDTSHTVAEGNVVRLTCSLLDNGGIELAGVEVLRPSPGGAVSSHVCLHSPVAIDPTSLHGDLLPPAEAGLDKPFVVLGSGDACWAPDGQAAIVVGFNDGQHSGLAGYLLEPVAKEASPLGWFPAHEVIHWRLGWRGGQHPLVDAMIGAADLPDELCERAMATASSFGSSVTRPRRGKAGKQLRTLRGLRSFCAAARPTM